MLQSWGLRGQIFAAALWDDWHHCGGRYTLALDCCESLGSWRHGFQNQSKFHSLTWEKCYLVTEATSWTDTTDLFLLTMPWKCSLWKVPGSQYLSWHKTSYGLSSGKMPRQRSPWLLGWSSAAEHKIHMSWHSGLHPSTMNHKTQKPQRTILKATMPYTQKPSILRWENQESEGSLGYTVRLCPKQKLSQKKNMGTSLQTQWGYD